MKGLHTNELNIAIIQPDTLWENKEGNLKNITTEIDKLKEEHPVVDMIALPEMFSTGFTMNPKPMAETMKGVTIEWMREIAEEMELAICGSLIIEENKKYYNRFVFIKPNGELELYDKKHLFGYAGEDKNYTAGNKKITINYKGWKINPFICYDLRFPVWCRNTDEADIMIFAANWPKKRIGHWQKLLPARAVENQCYVIGINRVGIDFNKLTYNGQSSAFDPHGKTITNMKNREGYSLITLKKSNLTEIRNKLPFWKDSDFFKIS